MSRPRPERLVSDKGIFAGSRVPELIFFSNWKFLIGNSLKGCSTTPIVQYFLTLLKSGGVGSNLCLKKRCIFVNTFWHKIDIKRFVKGKVVWILGYI